MAKKSPVIITMTISMGVKTACPVMTKPIASKSTCTIFFENGIQRVGKNALKRDPAFFYGGDDAAKSSLRQYNTSCRFGDIGCGRYGDAHLCLTQRGCIVGAIAAHPDRMPALLERLDEVKFSFRKNACEYREVLWL